MRVLVVNRSSVTLDAWAVFLAGDPRVTEVGRALDEDEAFQRAHEVRYDLVVTGRDCVARLSQWRRVHGPGIGDMRLVMLSHDVSVPMQKYAFVSGFDAVVDSNLSRTDLVTELVGVGSGRVRLRDTLSTAPEFSDLVVSREAPEIVVRDDLDTSIVGLVAGGLSDKQIAASVYLSCQTVRNRVSRILHESGFANRTQLAVVHLRREQQRCHRCGSYGAPEAPVQEGVVGQFADAL